MWSDWLNNWVRSTKGNGWINDIRILHTVRLLYQSVCRGNQPLMSSHDDICIWNEWCSLDNCLSLGFTWNSEKPGTTCNHVSLCVSLRIMNIKSGINRKGGAEFTLVMVLSDFSKLHLHCRSPRRRSISRSRSRYGQFLWYLLDMVKKPLVIFTFFPLRSISRDRRRYRSLSKEKNNRRSRSLSRSRRYFTHSLFTIYLNNKHFPDLLCFVLQSFTVL